MDIEKQSQETFMQQILKKMFKEFTQFTAHILKKNHEKLGNVTKYKWILEKKIKTNLF